MYGFWRVLGTTQDKDLSIKRAEIMLLALCATRLH
jgi:hypothetical protein